MKKIIKQVLAFTISLCFLSNFSLTALAEQNTGTQLIPFNKKNYNAGNESEYLALYKVKQKHYHNITWGTDYNWYGYVIKAKNISKNRIEILDYDNSGYLNHKRAYTELKSRPYFDIAVMSALGLLSFGIFTVTTIAASPIFIISGETKNYTLRKDFKKYEHKPEKIDLNPNDEVTIYVLSKYSRISDIQIKLKDLQSNEEIAVHEDIDYVESCNINNEKFIKQDKLNCSFPYENPFQNIKLIGIKLPKDRTEKKLFLKQFKKIAKNNIIYIVFDNEEGVKQFNNYENKSDIPVYLFLPNGKFTNEELLKNGVTDIDTNNLGVKYPNRLIQAKEEALKNKAGIWAK